MPLNEKETCKQLIASECLAVTQNLRVGTLLQDLYLALEWINNPDHFDTKLQGKQCPLSHELATVVAGCKVNHQPGRQAGNDQIGLPKTFSFVKVTHGRKEDCIRCALYVYAHIMHCVPTRFLRLQLEPSRQCF